MIPEVVLDRLQALSGDDRSSIEHAFHQPVPTSIRCNPLKEVQVNGLPVPWCTTGVYLEQRPSFVADPLFHLGAYYVQEASSMFLEQFVRQTGMDRQPVAAIDLCASPGGKSTHLRSLLHKESLLICNEVMPKRRNVLEENIWKWGYSNVAVSQARAESFSRVGQKFDLVLLDAPCSGAGMMRKDAFAVEQWNAELVHQCADVQKTLVKDAWNILQPGGLLIYSTCTFMEEENEQQVRLLVEECDAELVELSLDTDWRIVNVDEGLYFLPHLITGEGLFMTAMRKPGVLNGRESAVASTEFASSPFADLTGLQLIKTDDLIVAVADRWAEFLRELMDELAYIIPGIPVYQEKKNLEVPHPTLALSEILSEEIPRLELSTSEAIGVLKGEVLRRDVSTGYAVATYQNLPFAWMKGAGNRWNQSWPKQWRIRAHDVGLA